MYRVWYRDTSCTEDGRSPVLNEEIVGEEAIAVNEEFRLLDSKVGPSLSEVSHQSEPPKNLRHLPNRTTRGVPRQTYEPELSILLSVFL